MTGKGFEKKYSLNHDKRFQRTLSFMKDIITREDYILDLGPENPFSAILKEEGYRVDNTPQGIDLDLDYGMVNEDKYTVITAFEIFEHMVSPFPLLRSAHAGKLFASVPLRLWFSNAYWNEDDPYDRHYHEFEARQFDMLLEKAGWKIKKSDRWKNRSGSFGIRPMLRNITPRHYIVYCERSLDLS